MASTPESEGRAGEIARKLAVPVAISAAGSAVGFLLTKRDRVREAAPKLREAVSDLPRPHVPERGVGELASDLRGKLDEVLGREPAADTEEESDGGSGSTRRSAVDLSEFEGRRRERQERRARRRQRSRR
jgi:hypothetical protein